MKRIVLAYSGSVATSAAIPWLMERHGAEVVTVTLDVGQGRELAHVRERALAAGAVRAHVLDARDEFVRRHVLPALRSGAFADPAAFATAAQTRPLVAACGLAIASGTASGGWRIVRTLGRRISDIQSPQGFVAGTGTTAIVQRITQTMCGSARSRRKKTVSRERRRSSVTTRLTGSLTRLSMSEA